MLSAKSKPPSLSRKLILPQFVLNDQLPDLFNLSPQGLHPRSPSLSGKGQARQYVGVGLGDKTPVIFFSRRQKRSLNSDGLRPSPFEMTLFFPSLTGKGRRQVVRHNFFSLLSWHFILLYTTMKDGGRCMVDSNPSASISGSRK